MTGSSSVFSKEPVLTVEMYSQYARKISFFLNRVRIESLGNDDVSIIVHARRDHIGRFCDIFCTVILRYSLALRDISDILWSSCFES